MTKLKVHLRLSTQPGYLHVYCGRLTLHATKWWEQLTLSLSDTTCKACLNRHSTALEAK